MMEKYYPSLLFKLSSQTFNEGKQAQIPSLQALNLSQEDSK